MTLQWAGWLGTQNMLNVSELAKHSQDFGSDISISSVDDNICKLIYIPKINNEAPWIRQRDKFGGDGL